MFNMIHTGMKIAEARKAKDMTQLELADRLGISFQAVSNWERGNSMPDISKLPEISELLAIPLDELLGKKSPLVKTMLVTSDADSIETTIAEVAEAAPLMKPSQTDALAGKLAESHDLSELDDLFPFLGQELCDRLFTRAIERREYEAIDTLAPFVSRGLIHDALLAADANDLPVGDLVCFADRELVSRLAMKRFREVGIGAIDDLAPFIDQATLGTIADEEFKANGLRHFECIAPFLSADKLRMFAKTAIDRGGIRAIAPIAPFLGRDFLAGYVNKKFI